MEQGKRKEDEQQLHAVRFAAGVAVLMACLERAALVSFFEQWRVWVFLALNLLLLAILFTSTYTTCSSSSSTPPIELSSSTREENNTNDVKHKSEGKKRILKQCGNLEPTKSTEDGSNMLKSESIRDEIIGNHSVEGEEKEEEKEEEEERGEADESKSRGLSKEELNERVEAFIAMFRQQYLVSDHSKVTSRSRRKSHRAPVMGRGCHFVPSDISVRH